MDSSASSTHSVQAQVHVSSDEVSAAPPDGATRDHNRSPRNTPRAPMAAKTVTFGQGDCSQHSRSSQSFSAFSVSSLLVYREEYKSWNTSFSIVRLK